MCVHISYVWLVLPYLGCFFCVPQAALARHQWVRCLNASVKTWAELGQLAKTMERSTIFNGENMENHHFSWENDGQSPFLMGKYGTSPFLMGKSSISMAIFNINVFVYQRVSIPWVRRILRIIPLRSYTVQAQTTSPSHTWGYNRQVTIYQWGSMMIIPFTFIIERYFSH